MLFNSLHFLIFIPIVTAIFFALGKLKNRRFWLLIASWYFYASWKPEFLLLLITSTLVDYFAGIRLEKTQNRSGRIFLLLLSLTVNLGLLAAFKYVGFVDYNLQRFIGTSALFQGHSFEYLVLPIGISFYTFQTISYTIDVFKRKQKAEHNFVKFALYVSFFPQLVAGPIERASNLLPQFDKLPKINYKRITSGLKLMFWGFFQKLVIADNMALLVDSVYSNPGSYYGLDIMLATLFFAVQIYGDFSGYTDIARGTARVMGIELRLNFSRPYFAKSITEFWQRWHMSLSSWFRDYIYIPLGGNRVKSNWHWGFNIMVTFVLSGLWHGAGWNFILWGFLHGLYYITERMIVKPLFSRWSVSVPAALKIITVFVLVNIAWVFFRSESVSVALSLLENMLNITKTRLNFDHALLARNVFLIVLLVSVHVLERRQNIINLISSKHWVVRWSVYYISVIMLLVLGNFGIKEFIYFRF
ncbi:MAG: MBOAT family O-acyltransferase [Bacteroidota bacterium]|nr:MBOAT family O-acyltransferase [Bacteroidota bacterium]